MTSVLAYLEESTGNSDPGGCSGRALSRRGRVSSPCASLDLVFSMSTKQNLFISACAHIRMYVCKKDFPALRYGTTEEVGRTVWEKSGGLSNKYIVGTFHKENHFVHNLYN